MLNEHVDRIEALESIGKTVMLISTQDKVIGMIAVADQIKQTTPYEW